MPVALFWSELPEYQPPLRLVPPDPDEFNVDDPTVYWQRLPAAPGPARRLSALPPPSGYPVWNEPRPVRDQMWRLLSLVLEVLDARRPLEHLRGIVAARVFESVRTRTMYLAGTQLRLRTLHTCRPAQRVLEVCGTAAAHSGHRRLRAIAVAARVEHRPGGWLCTAFRPL